MSPVIQPPNGTRDLYPIEAARRRFITEAWRRVSINHGFEEIDGPTFEHLELYTVKSGDGIVSELFSFRREGGEKDFALRPEFTPTLARMYAAKAKSLPSPTKWFTCGPFFRAERPQRGRLREFLQWNCDVMGGDNSPEATYRADAEVVACCVALLAELGLTSDQVRVRINNRAWLSQFLLALEIPPESLTDAFAVIDSRTKLSHDEFKRLAESKGIATPPFLKFFLHSQLAPVGFETVAWDLVGYAEDFARFDPIRNAMQDAGISRWCWVDFTLARGLAYYTGTVFEIIVDGERAVAGGGRYDNLIELFGGPPTPAVGFGMGDVVLSLVLQDKGLMPTDAELLEIAGQRPDVFVISNGTAEADAKLGGVVAELRRGERTGTQGLHVRRSYKATKKIGKLLQEAGDVRAKFAVILESGTEATIKNLQTGEQDQGKTPISELALVIRRRLA